MSATSASAVKSALETKGLGVPIFNTFAPLRKANGDKQELKYLVVTDYISNVPRSSGSGGYKTTTELVQIDVYQDRRARDHQFVRNVERALNGIKLLTAPERVFRVEPRSTVPTPDPDPNVERTTITIALRRRY